MAQKEFPCPSCGAALYFSPALQKLLCDHCGLQQAILPSNNRIEELDFHANLRVLSSDAATATATAQVLMVHCTTCGANTTLDEHVTADRCPFCDSAIVAQAMSKRVLKPQSLLPFRITKDHARQSYQAWLKGLWFAPNALKKMAQIEERLNGLYVPFWTYDADTGSSYTGQRGDDYWVTQTYTVMVNGKPQTRTRQVRKTRWRHVSGYVTLDFDDVLVLASHALPSDYTDALEPWDLRKLAGYDAAYLSGFVAQSYQVDLPNGFEVAKGKMAPAIRSRICSDIGGDHQRISTVDTQYDQVTFKHVLLPIWLASYRYHNKVYRFLVNARTGEVQGQRPWSAWKIAAAVIAALIVAGGLLALIAMR